MGSSAKMMSGRLRERPGDRDALLLSARQLARPVLEPVRQADGGDDGVEPRRLGLPAGERHRQRDVLERVERGDEVVGLEDEADLVAAQLGELLVVEGRRGRRRR